VAVRVNGTLDPDWGGAWSAGIGAVTYNFNSGVSGDVHLRNFYVNPMNGKVYESDILLTLGSGFGTQGVGASFDVTFKGKVAAGDIKLSDISNFYDSGGNYLLSDPQTLTITQGNGNSADITLYATDTLDSLRRRLNAAISFGLGQALFVTNPANAERFAVLVEDERFGTQESNLGTLVIRSMVPGKDGRLRLSGADDVINALGLITIQGAEESVFDVSVYETRSGRPVARDVIIGGNTLYGVINGNVDVSFDPMGTISTGWSDSIRGFSWSGSGTYETSVTLKSNRTMFQVGANEGENIGVGIGNMSAEALGLSNVRLTDRESASRAVTTISKAIDRVLRQRAQLGSQEKRLEHAMGYLATASENVSQAESRIRDADMAREAMRYAKLKIMSHVGTAIFAQANQSPQNVLSLLL
jgi:flagellin